MRIVTVAASLLLLWPLIGAAQEPQETQETQEAQASPASTEEKAIYTWTDDKGVVHYEDERPTDANAEVEKLETGQEQGISTIQGTGLRESEKEFLEDAQKLNEIEARQQANRRDKETIVIMSEDQEDSADGTVIVNE